MLYAICSPSGKHAGILTHFQTKVNKKTNKKNSPQRTQRFFLDRIDTDSSIVSNHGLARIKGKKLKNLYQSLGFPLRLCNLSAEAENAHDPF
ncbi:hypothetical protein ES703_114610 [subsurface metagenome]